LNSLNLLDGTSFLRFILRPVGSYTSFPPLTRFEVFSNKISTLRTWMVECLLALGVFSFFSRTVKNFPSKYLHNSYCVLPSTFDVGLLACCPLPLFPFPGNYNSLPSFECLLPMNFDGVPSPYRRRLPLVFDPFNRFPLRLSANPSYVRRAIFLFSPS